MWRLQPWNKICKLLKNQFQIAYLKYFRLNSVRNEKNVAYSESYSFAPIPPRRGIVKILPEAEKKCDCRFYVVFSLINISLLFL